MRWSRHVRAPIADAIELADRGGRLVDRQPTPFSIGEVFESVAEMVRAIADEKGLGRRTLLAGNDRRIGHPSALSRVLLNLSVNALELTHEGYVEIAAMPSADEGTTIWVRDTGPGLAQPEIETLSQPFRRSRARNEYLLCETGLG